MLLSLSVVPLPLHKNYRSCLLLCNLPSLVEELSSLSHGWQTWSCNLAWPVKGNTMYVMSNGGFLSHGVPAPAQMLLPQGQIILCKELPFSLDLIMKRLWTKSQPTSYNMNGKK